MNCSELDGATIPEQYSSRISGTFSWKKRLMNRLSCCFHAYVAIGHVGVKCLTGFRKSWGRLLKTRKEKKRGRGEKLFIDPIIRLSAVSPSQRYWSYLLAIREDPCEYIFAAGIRKIPYMHLFSKAQGTLPWTETDDESTDLWKQMKSIVEWQQGRNSDISTKGGKRNPARLNAYLIEFSVHSIIRNRMICGRM